MKSRDLRPLTTAERAMVEPERLRRGEVLAPDGQVPDSEGRIGFPLVSLSTLEAMARRGTIERRQLAAGEEFHRLFRLASLDALKAAAMDRVGGGGGAPAEVPGNERARKRIADTMRVLGGERAVTASCAWHVLGLEWSLQQWSEKAVRGNVHRAAGILLATLDVLAPHFGC